MFAFFDGDFYESIVDSFRVCESKFNEDAIIIVDDYANEALPGAAKATDEWLKVNRQFAARTEASLAIISLSLIHIFTRVMGRVERKLKHDDDQR